MAAIEEKGEFRTEIDGSAVTLTRDDLLVSTKNREGYVTQSDGGMTVVLDVNLTEQLVCEGYVREIISKIQTMRKESGFEVTDHISVALEADPQLRQALEAARNEICRSVLADELAFAACGGKEWDINGLACKIALKKL